jgi:hypothetical protein
MQALPLQGSPANVLLYGVVLLSFALVKAWPAPACNNPIFAEIGGCKGMVENPWMT